MMIADGMNGRSQPVGHERKQHILRETTTVLVTHLRRLVQLPVLVVGGDAKHAHAQRMR